MSDGISNFLMKLLAIVIYLGIGALISMVFYNIKKKELFGGYIGGWIVGVIGALIGGFIIDKLILNRENSVKIIIFLTEDTGVNIITALLGGYLAVYILNRLGHNKERKKY